MDGLKQGWLVYRTLPTPWQLGIVAAALVLLTLGVSAGGGAVAHWKDRRFDAAEAKRAGQRQALEAERDAAITRAEAAEARAALREQQVQADRAVVASTAKTVREKQADLERIQHETQQAIDAADDPTLTPDERDERRREQLRRLGYLP